MSITTQALPGVSPTLSLARIHAMRGAYLLMGVGLALVEWPTLTDIHRLPLYEGVTRCLLTAMSLLAIVGVRYPVKLLPLLLFETVWKVLWLGLVALPKALAGTLDTATTDTIVSCSLVILVIAATPWRYVTRNFIVVPGDRWR